MHENYDHQAILTAAAMLKAAASADAQRLLIVLSDGMPHGAQYAGKQAMDATREAAELVRRTGTQLLAIAIADYAAESIYDARYTLKYTQLQEFPQKFRSLLMRLLRRSAIG
jgi:nitric oxide reductase activation protein